MKEYEINVRCILLMMKEKLARMAESSDVKSDEEHYSFIEGYGKAIDDFMDALDI